MFAERKEEDEFKQAQISSYPGVPAFARSENLLGDDLAGVQLWYFYTLQVGQTRQPGL